MEEQKREQEINSLESPVATGSTDKRPDSEKPKPKKGKLFQRLISHFNVYLLVFILLVVVVAGVALVSYNRQKNLIEPGDVPSQQLSEEAFNQLQSGDTSVGDPKQTLTVQSNAIFSGQVLARSDLEIAGTLKVGGALNLAGLVVSGDSTFDQIQGNDISIDGDGNFQGQLSVSRGLTVTGGGSFGGPISAPIISVESLQLSGDLQFTRHIDAGGPTPTRSNGAAIGGGGTTSISGTDTAGTININTGGSASAGCFVSVQFARAFSATPHVVVTPTGSNGAGLNYYVTRNTTGFSLCSTNAPPSGSNFSFDYIVID